MAADATYVPKIQERNGGDLLAVASGGTLDIESGGKLTFAGVDQTAALALAPAAVAAGYKIARGVAAVTNAGSGIATVVTGLATVVAIIATMVDDPTTTCEMVTASIGDQAGAPAAGSVYLKGWKTLGGTPAAMTTTTVNVNWIAIGT